MFHYICTNLSPVCEDDAECEDAEDKESSSAGRDDEKVDGRRRTVGGGAVLDCLEIRHTCEGGEECNVTQPGEHS